MNQIAVLDAHPIGYLSRDERLAVAASEGGIADCSRSGACWDICPMGVSLDISLAQVTRAALRYASSRVLGTP